jgi:hypothetical protein
LIAGGLLYLKERRQIHVRFNNFVFNIAAAKKGLIGGIVGGVVQSILNALLLVGVLKVLL